MKRDPLKTKRRIRMEAAEAAVKAAAKPVKASKAPKAAVKPVQAEV